MTARSTCARYALDLSALAAGDLESRRLEEIASHLGACAACRELLAALREQRSALASLGEPESFEEALSEVRQRVLERVSSPARRSTLNIVRPGWVAAAALVLLASLTFAIWERTRTIPPQSASRVAPKTAPVPPALEAARAAAPESVAPHAAARDAGPGARAPAPEPSPGSEEGGAEVWKVLSAARGESMVVRLQTDDPNVVVYWIVADTGGPS